MGAALSWRCPSQRPSAQSDLPPPTHTHTHRTYTHRLQQELELQQHSLQLLQERVAGSEGHQLAEALAATEAALAAAQEEAAAAAQKKKDMAALAKVCWCAECWCWYDRMAVGCIDPLG